MATPPTAPRKPLTCALGLHRWDACTCRRCGIRRESHRWEGCLCSVCGADRHRWTGCTCQACGVVHADGHAFELTRCTICGFVRDDEPELLAQLTRAVVLAESAQKGTGNEVADLMSRAERVFFESNPAPHRLKDGRISALLARGLRVHNHDAVAFHAAKVLGQLGEFDVLVAALGDPRVEKQGYVIRALIELGDAARVGPLLVKLLADPEHAGQAAAGFHSLGYRGDDAAVALWKVTIDPKSAKQVRETAQKMIAVVCPDWLNLPAVKDSRDGLVEILRNATIQQQKNSFLDGYLGMVMDVMAQAGDERAAEPIARMVGDHVPIFCGQALDTLCLHWPKAGLRLACSLLTAPTTPSSLCDSAIGALPDVVKRSGEPFDDPAVIDAIIRVATRDVGHVIDANQEASAIKALGRLGNPRAVGPLLKLLKRANVPHYLRSAASEALESLGISKEEILAGWPK